MINLEKINISNNKLEFLPEEIGRITSLKIFDVSNNLLCSLPFSLANLNLQTIIINGNQYYERLFYGKLDTENILKNLKHLSGKSTTWNKLKVILIGYFFSIFKKIFFNF